MCNVSADSVSKYTFAAVSHNPDGEMPFFTIGFDLSRLAQPQKQHRLTVLNRLLHLYAIFNNGYLSFA